MKKLLLLSFLFTFSNVFSQRTKGLILDAITQQPIEKAHIFLPNKIVYSNSKGEFKYDLKRKDSIVISISHVQYATQKFMLTKSNRNQTFLLYERQENLSEITIEAKVRLKNSLNYTILNDLPTAIYSFASSIKDGKIYTFGGDVSSKIEKNKECLSLPYRDFGELLKCLNRPNPGNFDNYKDDLQVYNIESKSWSTTKEKLIKRAYHKSVTHNDKIYLLGGKKFSRKKQKQLLEDVIEVVSSQDLSVEKDQSNPHKAVDFGSAVFEDKIIVFGGSTKLKRNGNKVYSDEVHFYDLKSGYWYLLTKMSKGKEVSGIVFGNKLYLFGGFNKKNLTEIESFDFVTGKWNKEGNLFSDMQKPAITKDNEFIYLHENGKIVTFEPNTKELKEYTIDLKLKGSEIQYYNSTIYILGGYAVEDFRKFPSNGFYSLQSSEFFTTKPFKEKTLTN